MKQRITSLFSLSCLLAAPLLAQTTIGGGTCNSASLKGVYAVSITSRQVTVSPFVTTSTFTGVFQANGSATFDGLSQVAISLVANTNAAVATPLTWSGTYSVQANCAGVMDITMGGSATLNLAIYNSGTDFLLSGSDANSTYSGNGNAQPAGCSATTFSGVYTFSGTGFALNGTDVSGADNGSGLLQFDGVSRVTVNLTMSASRAVPIALTLTGSYSITSGCLGSATLTDASLNSYVMSFSIYNSTVNNAASYVGLAQSSKLLVSGSAHAAYGQPAASAEVDGPAYRPAVSIVTKPNSISAGPGGQA